MCYPRSWDSHLLLRHPQVESASRCQIKTQEETRQVVVTLCGPLIKELTLRNWGTFHLRPCTPEPMRCFRCHRYGHRQATCKRQVVCSLWSWSHDTDVCITKFKAGEVVMAHCPNCHGRHHAWHPRCPSRLALVDQGRRRQVAWVQQWQINHPASPGMFIWGTQGKPKALPLPILTSEAFPPLTASVGPAHTTATATPNPQTPTPKHTQPASHHPTNNKPKHCGYLLSGAARPRECQE